MRYLRTTNARPRLGCGSCAQFAIHPRGCNSGRQRATSLPRRRQRPGATNSKAVYYVDFRSRTAAQLWPVLRVYGAPTISRSKSREWHPGDREVCPIALGHLIRCPAELGKSYGDLDEVM